MAEMLESPNEGLEATVINTPGALGDKGDTEQGQTGNVGRDGHSGRASGRARNH